MALRYLLFFFFLMLFLTGHCENEKQHNCPRSFDCGSRGRFQYPFTKAELPYCGLLLIHGCEDTYYFRKMIQLDKNATTLELTGSLDSNTIITIYDADFHASLEQNKCHALNTTYTLPPPSPLLSIYIEYNVSLFRCNHNLRIKLPLDYGNFTCGDYDIYYDKINTSPTIHDAGGIFSHCSLLHFATKDAINSTDVLSFLSSEIALKVVLSPDCDDCFNHRRGQCQLDTNNKFYCDEGSSTTNRLVKKMGLALALATLVLVIIALYYKRWKKQNQTLPLVDAFFERHDHLQIKRYSYSEMKKVTNSFKNKLGQGGFGSVYKGQLQDGRHVAVKILSEFKGDGQEFINEVASMSRTSHVNIVALLGFCFEGSKRALVYELMPNGSLEKLIYNENSVIGDRQLDCQTLYDIAIGVARGLEYLHKGCNTKILHFDIKPHNILLDEKFCPKISDFGLAKVCTRKESIVSIFGARGTAGYIAPEVFSRNFGAVSHKSDVYSYGMMVLEMVGRRKNIKAEVDVSSEIYFPHWIYNRLVSNQELDLQNIRNECDNEMVRKMTIVSLWCIQTNPSTRPSISKVVEMLEGSAELLQLPPKPYWFSPSNSP
ncbi:hypothetical protein AAHE18_09G196100 [Arachis hypogaea]